MGKCHGEYFINMQLYVFKDISYQNNDAYNGVVIEISLFHTTIILARVWSIISENDTLRRIPGFNKSPLPVFIAGIGGCGSG